MEAMRLRLFAAVASLGLLSAIVGCHHTAGCCDCEYEGYGCCANCGGYGGYGGHNGGIPADAHVLSSVPIAPPVAGAVGTAAAPPIPKLADADKPVDKIPAAESKPDDAVIK
jgi:hypothetical protein